MSDGSTTQIYSPAGTFSVESELELLKVDTDSLRTFYSLSGPARKEFIIMMAEAEAAKVAAVADAQAKGLLAMRRAEAEGYKLIGEALASVPNTADVLEVARLHALERIAAKLADGHATKMFLPQSMDGLLGLLSIGRSVNGAVSEMK